MIADSVFLTDDKFNKMRRNGVYRPLLASGSDGTLRFLCLAVALLSPRPPAFLAINEPENSLHHQMFPALARLIVEAISI